MLLSTTEEAKKLAKKKLEKKEKGKMKNVPIASPRSKSKCLQKEINVYDYPKPLH